MLTVGMDAVPILERRKGLAILAAALAPLLACALLAAFRASVTTTTAALVLVLLVVAAASTGMRKAGITAAVSSGVWFDFFLTQPYERLTITDPDDIEATVLLVLIGAAVTEVALWGHRQQTRASRRAGYLDGVLGTADIVTSRNETPEVLIDQVAKQIAELLVVDRCRFVSGPLHDPRIPVLDHKGLVTRQGHPINVDQDGLPTDDEIALPITRADVTLGHFLLTASAEITRPTLEQRKVAVLFADQVGGVLPNTTR